MGDHTLEFDAIHLLEQSGGHGDRRVVAGCVPWRTRSAPGRRRRRWPASAARRRCTIPRRGCAGAAYSSGDGGVGAAHRQGDLVGVPVRAEGDGGADHQCDAGEQWTVAEEQADDRADDHDDHQERDDEQSAAALVRADQFKHADGRRQNSTVGATRAPSSASKYSRSSKLSILAKNTAGTDWILLLNVEHAVVVELAGVGDATLGAGQLLLQRQEVLVGLQVGVGLAQGEHLAQRTGEHVVGLRLGVRRVRCGDGRVAGLDDGFERAAFVRGVALDGFDEVRDEIEPALQLDVDLRPGVVDLVAAPDQAVVGADEDGHDHQDDHDDDDDAPHVATSLGVGPAHRRMRRCTGRGCDGGRPSATDRLVDLEVPIGESGHREVLGPGGTS